MIGNRASFLRGCVAQHSWVKESSVYRLRHICAHRAQEVSASLEALHQFLGRSTLWPTGRYGRLRAPGGPHRQQSPRG